MLKKLYGKINGIFAKLGTIHQDLSYLFNKYHDDSRFMQSAISSKKQMDSMANTIASQQRTIEQLTNALKDKYEHGLFVFSEDGKIVTAIQDGEEIMANRMSYLNVEWSVGEAVSVTVERR